MTADIFSGWLNDWDVQLTNKKRHILLTTDNCPIHFSVQNLDFIKLVFLPPKTISVLQLMDHAQIKFMKQLILQFIHREEQKTDNKNVVFDTVLMTSDKWNIVTTTTKRKCSPGVLRCDK